MQQNSGDQPTAKSNTMADHKAVATVLIRGLLALIVFYIVAAPVHTFLPLQLTWSVYNEKRLIQLIFLIALGLILWISRSDRLAILETFQLFPTLVRRLLSMVAILGLLSAALARLPIEALLELSLFLLLFVLCLSSCLYASQRPVTARIVAIAAAAALAGAYSVDIISFYLAYLPSGQGLSYRDYIVGFANPRFLNQIQSWLLPFLGLTLHIPGVRQWILSVPLWLIGSLFWMIVFASAGRGTPLAMVAAGIVVVLCFGRKALPWLIRQVTMAATGFILYQILWIPVLSKVPIFARTYSMVSRLEFWRNALHLFIQGPVLGVGPGGYRLASTTEVHPHNAWLQWLCEWGLISTAIMAMLVIWGVWLWLRQSRLVAASSDDGDDVDMRIALTASLIAAGAHAMLSGIIVMPLSQLVGALIIGVCLAVYRRGQPAVTGPPLPISRYRDLALRLGLLLTVGAVLIGAVHTWFNAMELRKAFWQSSVQMRMNPRIWLPEKISPSQPPGF